MKYALAALIVLLAAAPVRAATGVEALERFEGTWQSTATALATPYSKAGSTTGDTTCGWSTARDFLICQQAVTSDGALTHDVAVYTYDAAAEKYRFYAARITGVFDVAIAVDTATTITYTNTFQDGGKERKRAYDQRLGRPRPLSFLDRIHDRRHALDQDARRQRAPRENLAWRSEVRKSESIAAEAFVEVGMVGVVNASNTHDRAIQSIAAEVCRSRRSLRQATVSGVCASRRSHP